MLKRKSTISQYSGVPSRKFQQMHKYCADVLNRKTKNWSRCRQKCFLFVTCLIMGGISTNLLYNIIIADKKKTISYTLALPLLKPRVMHHRSNAHTFLRDTIIFYHFRKTVDSMLQTPEGRKAYGEFLQQRPGFPDSMAKAEKLLKQTIPH